MKKLLFLIQILLIILKLNNIPIINNLSWLYILTPIFILLFLFIKSLVFLFINRKDTLKQMRELKTFQQRLKEKNELEKQKYKNF